MWGRGRRRKKKEVGRLGYSCHCYQSPAFLGTLEGMWKGKKRQLKPVGVGPVPHPHPGHWGQLYPFCWTRLDRAPGAPGGALASRSSPCGSPCPFVTALPGQGVSVYLWQSPSRASLSHSPYCPPESASSLPAFLQSLWLRLSLRARTFFFIPFIPSKLFCWPLLGSPSLSLLFLPGEHLLHTWPPAPVAVGTMVGLGQRALAKQWGQQGTGASAPRPVPRMVGSALLSQWRG